MTPTRPIFSIFLFICLLVATPVRASDVDGAPDEPVSVDPRSGIAIDGFDPVAYFVDGAPRAGKAEFETTWQDATWRFASAANREAFHAHPDVFAPAFGGHDAEAGARGVTVGADPRVFLIAADRLHFFRSEASKARFVDESTGHAGGSDPSPLAPPKPR